MNFNRKVAHVSYIILTNILLNLDTSDCHFYSTWYGMRAQSQMITGWFRTMRSGAAKWVTSATITGKLMPIEFMEWIIATSHASPTRRDYLCETLSIKLPIQPGLVMVERLAYSGTIKVALTVNSGFKICMIKRKYIPILQRTYCVTILMDNSLHLSTGNEYNVSNAFIICLKTISSSWGDNWLLWNISFCSFSKDLLLVILLPSDKQLMSLWILLGLAKQVHNTF